MDVHPTSFRGHKAPLVKSKYKKASEEPKEKNKEAPKQTNRRTFGTIRNPNVEEKAVLQKPKSKPSDRKQPKTEPEIAFVHKALELSAKKTESNERQRMRKKKTVSFHEKIEVSGTKESPATELNGVKTPVRPPFSVKPVRIPGTPYLTAEKCSSCQFDRLETASYWLGQIKSAEAVGKHFVSAAFFRLAYDCKAEPVRNLQIELKKYLARHDYLYKETEWEGIFGMYGILKKECEIKSNANLFEEEGGSKVDDAGNMQEQRVDDQNDEVKEINELKT